MGKSTISMAMASIAFCYVYQRVHIQIYVIDHGLIPNMCNSSFDPWTHDTWWWYFGGPRMTTSWSKKNRDQTQGCVYIYTLVYNVIQYDYSIYGLTRFHTGWFLELDSWVDFSQGATGVPVEHQLQMQRLQVQCPFLFFVAKGFMEGEPWKMLGYNIA